MEFLENAPQLLKILWYIALPTSIIFLIQTVLTFIGADNTDGLNADFESDLGHSSDTPLQLFSFRNLINFLLGFGWGGISFFEIIENPNLLILVAFLIGISFVAIFFFIIKQLLKLSEDNSFQFEQLINKNGEVYLKIPANKAGKGKVQVSLKGSVRELDAITEGDVIESGQAIRIVKIENNNLLIVEKI